MNQNQSAPPPTSRFATVHGSAGQNPRTLGPLRVFWPLAPICLVTGYLFRAALPYPELSTTQAGFLFLALAVFIAVFIGWSARRLRSFLKGAEGEEKVARVLSFLPASHTVFNDLELEEQGADFDHVVVAPSGIYVIETKNWRGDITFENGMVLYNGQIPNRAPLAQVKEAAVHLAEHLVVARCQIVPIYPILCFVDNSLQCGLSNIDGVEICTDTNLYERFETSSANPLETTVLAAITEELARCTDG